MVEALGRTQTRAACARQFDHWRELVAFRRRGVAEMVARRERRLGVDVALEWARVCHLKAFTDRSRPPLPLLPLSFSVVLFLLSVACSFPPSHPLSPSLPPHTLTHA